MLDGAFLRFFFSQPIDVQRSYLRERLVQFVSETEKVNQMRTLLPESARAAFDALVIEIRLWGSNGR